MFKIDGLDKLQRKLKDLERRTKDLHGQHSVPLGELFPPAFMRQNTDFGSIDEMFEASGFKVETEEDFSRIPDDEWNRFIALRTRFESWDEMMKAGGEAWAAKRLGF
jgi:hypothetical protein